MEAVVSSLTRKELYDQVWSTPMARLAKNFGVSGVWLAKICRSYRIPHPPRGYWAKKRNGKSVRRKPLPPSDNPDETIEFGTQPETSESARSAEFEIQPEPVFDSDIMAIYRKARSLETVRVSAELRDLHPIVRSTREALREGRTDRHNLVYPPYEEGSGALDVLVSKSNVRRALLFLDALIKAFEKVGGKIEVRSDRYRDASISVAGERVSSPRLRERCKHVKRIVDPKDRHWDWHKFDCVPSGLLVLEEPGGYFPRVYCQDTPKRRRIENAINEVILTWITTAGENRIRRRQEEEDRRQREKEDRIRREQEAILQRQQAEEERKRQQEQARIDELLRKATAWQQSRLLRDFLATVEAEEDRRCGGIEENSPISQWLTWAREQADKLDPLHPNKEPSGNGERHHTNETSGASSS